MKFKGAISKIDSEGVKGKTDNPHRKPTEEQFGWHTQSGFDDQPSGWQIEGGEEAYCELLETWHEAEANREEYEVKPSELLQTLLGGFVLKNTDTKIIEGDRIEGDIVNNQIVNVKLIV